MKWFIIHKVNIYSYIIICDSFLHLKWKKNLNSSWAVLNNITFKEKKISLVQPHALCGICIYSIQNYIHKSAIYTHIKPYMHTKEKELVRGQEREKERDLHLFYISHYCQELQKQISVKMTITEEHAAKQEASVTPPPSHQGNAWSSSRHFFRKPLKDQIDIQRARRPLKTKQNQLNWLWKARHNWQIEA